MNYTIVVHKSSGSTSCRGCIMDQWDSDFDMDYFTESEHVVSRAVPYILTNMKDEELGNYEVTILYNGVPHNYLDDENVPDLYKEACVIARQKANEYKNAKEQKRLEAKQAEQDRKKADDLKLLEKLKKQYGEV